MNIKTQLKRLEHYEVKHRSAVERFGAVLLAAATIFSMTELGHDKINRLMQREVLAVQPIYVSAAENEVERTPIKFDDGILAQNHAGL